MNILYQRFSIPAKGVVSCLLLNLLAAPTAVMAEINHELQAKFTAMTLWSDGIVGGIENDRSTMSRLQDDDGLQLSGKVQMAYGLDGDNFGFYGHGQLTSDAEDNQSLFGLVQLYGYYRFDLTDSRQLTVTAGQLFMPSSFENSEAFWDSPYSNNYSALNTWIAQEVRPIGVELKYDYFDPDKPNGLAYGFGAMLFGNNDSMGSQLTWRGWSIGRHKSSLGEVVPLPALYQFDNGIFVKQRHDESQPFGEDLDDRLGYLFHSYWSPTDRLNIKVSYLDNGGDDRFYRNEYSWHTEFVILGARWKVTDSWTILSEFMSGSSSMGPQAKIGVDASFDTSYIIARYQQGLWDYSVRLEYFRMKDRVLTPAEANDRGKAFTLSARWRAFGKPLSVIAEWLVIDADDERRPMLTGGIFFNDENESQVSVSLNYEF